MVITVFFQSSTKRELTAVNPLPHHFIRITLFPVGQSVLPAPILSVPPQMRSLKFKPFPRKLTFFDIHLERNIIIPLGIVFAQAEYGFFVPVLHKLLFQTQYIRAEKRMELPGRFHFLRIRIGEVFPNGFGIQNGMIGHTQPPNRLLSPGASG